MDLFSTLEEAIEAAREDFMTSQQGVSEEDVNVSQFGLQKYVMQDGDIMWQAEFFASEDEQGDCLPLLSGEAAQAVFDGDFDEIEMRQEWQSENTLHEWDDGEFQLAPQRDLEEGEVAAEEWEDDNTDSDNLA
ncbi:MysB family protein [Pantoea sp. Acro-807]|uniref:MysB family protein n=1 Tax=Pantoea sp. Acro-807 TaxID=2608356 RepID=UPI001419EFA8|nr:MysB family protein [Pantoea sp. Acro-807]NIE69795.1 secY/secA suppressor protein [Pantoea sp. Acro-807]